MFRMSRPIVALGGLGLAASVAVAGNGVGGVFNLGQVNGVNARTQLQGTTATQQLLVNNRSASANSSAIYGASTGGTGVTGVSSRSVGLRGAVSAGTGVNYGVFGSAASADGYAGYFRNSSTTTDRTKGQGIRVLAAGASPNLFNAVSDASGGEFAGPTGVVGIASRREGVGVLGNAGPGATGVFGISASQVGAGGFFRNISRTGVAYGVRSLTASPNGFAGHFRNTGANGHGIRAIGGGASDSSFATEIAAAGEFAGPNGLLGIGTASNGAGVVGRGRIYGVAGTALTTTAYGVYSEGNAGVHGNLEVTGAITKGSGSFKIDHPLDPANRYLSHSFVESPDMMNIYNGNVVTDADGVATVELPSYFEALNRDPRYQLTVIGSFAAAQISQEISDNRFAIRTSEPDVKVSWQVTGIRQDAYAAAHPIVVEEDKPVAERGRYLHPVEHGMPAALSIGNALVAQAGATDAIRQ
jgi:hypothetical protein